LAHALEVLNLQYQDAGLLYARNVLMQPVIYLKKIHISVLGRVAGDNW